MADNQRPLPRLPPSDPGMEDTRQVSRRCSTRTEDSIVERPQRPLNAYNYFFQEERRRMLNLTTSVPPQGMDESKTPHGVGFAPMARAVSRRWKNISPAEKAYYVRMAEQDKLRYFREMDVWYKQNNEDGTQASQGTSDSPTSNNSRDGLEYPKHENEARIESEGLPKQALKQVPKQVPTEDQERASSPEEAKVASQDRSSARSLPISETFNSLAMKNRLEEQKPSKNVVLPPQRQQAVPPGSSLATTCVQEATTPGTFFSRSRQFEHSTQAFLGTGCFQPLPATLEPPYTTMTTIGPNLFPKNRQVSVPQVVYVQGGSSKEAPDQSSTLNDVQSSSTENKAHDSPETTLSYQRLRSQLGSEAVDFLVEIFCEKQPK